MTDPIAKTTSSTRLELFSDAVFAIVITLLAVEISRPEVEPGELRDALIGRWPSYLAFALGFLYVGVIWLNHHGVFRHVMRSDLRFNWINLGLLGTTTLMPFATGVLATSFETGNRSDQEAAVVLYACVAGLMSLAWVPVFSYLHRHPELSKPDTPPGLFGAQRTRPFVGIAVFSLAAFLGGWLHPAIALGLFVLMLAYHAFTSEGVPTR